MMNYTCWFDTINSASIALVGGKGANLGELTSAQIPVPRGFCVTTLAYQQLIQSNLLQARIVEALDGLDHDDASDIACRAQSIRDMIMTAQVPTEIAAAISEGYAQLESALGQNVPVSVRSSATAEDLPGMSFAGQQDTYLNISGAAEVLHHVKRCWASLWTDRAIAYRHKQGFKHEEVWLAVVVQEMFPSEAAGVLLTANPVTSNPGEIVVNSSWGLGEAIVSGQVNPDQHIVDKATLAITKKTVNDKRVMTVRQDGQGSATVEVPEAKRLVEALGDDQIKELCRIALGIEKHYGGFPQDIEWGYSQGRFAILQSREVTAANIDFPEGLEAFQTPEAKKGLTDERWVWSRAYSDEVQTGPSSPLFYSYLENGMTNLKISLLRFTETTECLGYPAERFGDIPFYRWYGARAYYNLAFEKERIRMFIPPFARDEAALYPFPAEEREQIKNMPFNWIRFIWIMLKLHVSHPKVSLLETTHHEYENHGKWLAYADALWAALDMDTATPKEILATQAKAAAFAAGFGENVVLPFTIYLYVLPAALRTLLEMWCDDKDMQLYNRLVAGLQTKTSEENIAVWALSRTVKKSRTLMKLFQKEDVKEVFDALERSEDGRRFKADLDIFIKKYGHRGGAERDAIHYRWRHKPERVFNSIKPMLALGEEDDPAEHERRLHERMLQAKEECLRRARSTPLGSLKSPVLEWGINLTQDYVYYRDYERFHNDKSMSFMREIYVAIARNFIRRGLMVHEEDIFFLSKEEVVAVDDGQLGAKDIERRVRARRTVYERYSHTEPPKYVRGWHTFDDDQLPDDGQGLRGIAASTGVVTGRARVCRRLEEIRKVEKGDILVTVATDPGWTTVFSIIKGVVVETGGVVAHAVMISREYGLPCVANVKQACDLIPDGQIITVDGTNGRVLIHESAA